MKLIATSRSFASWQSRKEGKLLRMFKTTAAPSAYLSISSRSAASLRARLRLDRSTLNESRLRRGMPVNPNCTSCGVPEDLDHVLLSCPRFAAARTACQTALRILNQPFTTPSLLACGSLLKYRTQLRFLSATDDFLAATLSTRSRLWS